MSACELVQSASKNGIASGRGAASIYRGAEWIASSLIKGLARLGRDGRCVAFPVDWPDPFGR
jgi:hypothetical protein